MCRRAQIITDKRYLDLSLSLRLPKQAPTRHSDREAGIHPGALHQSNHRAPCTHIQTLEQTMYLLGGRRKPGNLEEPQMRNTRHEKA